MFIKRQYKLFSKTRLCLFKIFLSLQKNVQQKIFFAINSLNKTFFECNTFKNKMKLFRKYIFLIICCIFFSKIFSQQVEMPVIESINVNLNTQKVVIRWSVQFPDSVDGYIIKRQIWNVPGVVDGTFNTIATITDPRIFIYEDTSSQFGEAKPTFRPEFYRIAAYRMLNGIKKISLMSDIHSTIFLTPIKFDICELKNTLNWNHYVGWGDSLKEYKIYQRFSASDVPILLTTVPKNDTTFIHSNLSDKISYFYCVEAVNVNEKITAISNQASKKVYFPHPPSFMNADFGTVLQENQIQLSFTVDTSHTNKGFKLVESSEINGQYSEIAFFEKPSIPKIVFNDTANTSSQVHFYKLIAVSVCNSEWKESNIAHNIVLRSSTSSEKPKINNLIWNTYQTWRGGVEKYKLYRSLDNENFELRDTLSAKDSIYMDDVSNLTNIKKGMVCYYVEAEEKDENPYQIKGFSRSNVECVAQNTELFLPNAFNPNSDVEENRIFKPNVSFVKDFYLIIYSRWGNIIFESKNPDIGWDGKSEGNLVPKGVYVYYLKYITSLNQVFERVGAITLIY